MKKVFGCFLGAILIASGTVCILNTFGITDAKISLNGWWTLFIIIPCLGGIVNNKEKLSSFVGLVCGILLLLAARDVFEYETVWETIVPIVIICLGIKLIIKTVSSKKSGNEENVKILNAQADDYADEEITVAKVGAVFGGTKCNLTDAKIKDGSRLELLCVFGGADIIVPENVNVKVNTFCLFGGISDKRTVREINAENVTLTINGFCMFGGADIKFG